MILRLQYWLAIGLVLSACAPLRQDKGDGGAIKSPPQDDDGEPKLKVAYSMDDISEVEIVPKKLQVEPWQPVQLFLAGTLPDDTQGRIPSEVQWSTDDEDVAIIGKTTGELIAKRAGKVTVRAKFRKLDDKRTINVDWLSKLHQELMEPEEVTGRGVDANIIQVGWRFGDGPVTGHQLAYRQGDPPASCLEQKDGITVVPAADIADLTQVTLLGLEPDSEYGIRLCSVQELSTEGLVARRFSAGVTVSAKTKTE